MYLLGTIWNSNEYLENELNQPITKPTADDAGSFRKQTFTKPSNDKERKTNNKQNPHCGCWQNVMHNAEYPLFF